MDFCQIQYDNKEPFKRLHQQIHKICDPPFPDHPGYRKSVGIIEMPYSPVKLWCPLLQNLFKSIGNTELPVHCHLMAMADPPSDGMHDPFISTCCHRAEIMLIHHNIRRSDLCGKPEIAGFCKGLDHGIRCLAKQQQNQNQNAKKGPHQQKRRCRPALCFF